MNSPQTRLVEQSIPDRFEHIVRSYPRRPALKIHARTFTYDELNRAANRIAHDIVTRFGRQSEPFALLFENGFEGIAAFLGLLKAGKFAVTLAPSFPLERLTQILEDCEARVIVTDGGHLKLARKFQRTHIVLNIDETDAAFGDNPGLPVSVNDVAAVMYTSGSTGTPKGVVRAHRTFLQLCDTYADKRRITVDDRSSLVHSLSFGSAYGDLLPALLHGALLLPFDLKAESMHRFAAWLDEEQITISHLPPLAFRQLASCLDPQNPLRHLRVMCLSGAAVTRTDFELYRQHFAPTTLLEIRMGSTETGAAASAIVNHDFSFPQEGTPIGYPQAGRTILLLDERRHEVGAGEVGEIAVKGRNMSLGYWRRPDLTAEKFLADPAGGDESIYLTGDLGRRLPDGMLIHLGRKDSLVKIRGYRIEIAEIERALAAHGQVRDAAVVAWDRAPGDKFLAAYVVPQPGAALSVSVLHNWLKGTLPDYMLPSSFTFLRSLPLTNGKVNRQALPRPDRHRPSLSSSYVAPSNDLEMQLVTLWENLLGTAPIGINDDFFALGGHSLLGAAIMAQVHDTLQADLPLRALFEAPTVAQLARCIAARRTAATYHRTHTHQADYLFELQSRGDRRPVFFFPGGGGGEPEFFIYARLAREVGEERPFYGLRARGADGVSSPHRSVITMARDYVADIQTLQPHGPYLLVGECFGGIVAYEVASQLQSMGETVAALILMDTQRPTPRIYWTYRAKYSLGPVGETLFNGRLAFHWEVLRDLPYAERISYVRSYAVRAARWALRSMSSAPESARARAQAVVELTASGRSRQHIMEARHRYRLTLRRHRPQPYSGPIQLLVNEQYHRRGPALGWDGLARGGLKIHKLPGNHDTYIREHVHVTATTLRTCLDDALNRISETPLQSTGWLLDRENGRPQLT